MSSEPRVKGVAFRSIDTCFAELRGEAARARAREQMNPAVRDAYQNGLILAASWYPIAWYKEVLRSLRAVGNDGHELVRSIGYRSAQRDMSGVYKQMFARLVSPQMLLGLSGRLFNTYYDTGQFRLIDSQRGFARVHCSDCVAWDQNMWTELTGASVALLEIAGAKEVRLRVTSGGKDGDTSMDLVAYWH